MAQSQVVIVYSPGQALRRTVVIPDDDSQVPIHTQNLQPGEAAVVVSLGLYRLVGPDAALASVLGRTAISDRCALADATGKVIGLIRADPAIDRRHPLGTLYHDPGAKAKVGGGVHNLGLLA
jgi:hypothetical protein